MKIHFSTRNSPLTILDERQNHVGSIKTRRRDITRKCECCGQEVWVKNVIAGYSLYIKGRYWGLNKVLRPNGKGGMAGVGMRKLSDIKALAVKVLS